MVFADNTCTHWRRQTTAFLWALAGSESPVWEHAKIGLNWDKYQQQIFSTGGGIPDWWLSLEGWVAKLLARLISAESSLGSNPDIPQKSYARYISKGVAITLYSRKKNFHSKRQEKLRRRKFTVHGSQISVWQVLMYLKHLNCYEQIGLVCQVLAGLFCCFSSKVSSASFQIKNYSKQKEWPEIKENCFHLGIVFSRLNWLLKGNMFSWTRRAEEGNTPNYKYDSYLRFCLLFVLCF
jgi:hypothetical protein